MYKEYRNFGHNDKNYCLIYKGNKIYNMVVKGKEKVNEYLNFKTTSANTLKLTKKGSPDAISLEYSFDKTNWTVWTDNSVRTISMPKNSTVYIRGNNSTFSSSASNYYSFSSTQPIECNGNIMSLLDKTMESLTIPNTYCFYSLFYNMSKLTTAPELPATTLAIFCYYCMFYGCTSLTTAPELPATTLEEHCYQYMFSRCTSLTTAPELPVTTLTNYCYHSMFEGCTSLTTAPDLPATNLRNYCYGHMFDGCTKLNMLKVYATTKGTNSQYHMLDGCTAPNAVLHVTNRLTWDSTHNKGSVGSNWTIVKDL